MQITIDFGVLREHDKDIYWRINRVSANINIFTGETSMSEYVHVLEARYHQELLRLSTPPPTRNELAQEALTVTSSAETINERRLERTMWEIAELANVQNLTAHDKVIFATALELYENLTEVIRLESAESLDPTQKETLAILEAESIILEASLEMDDNSDHELALFIALRLEAYALEYADSDTVQRSQGDITVLAKHLASYIRRVHPSVSNDTLFEAAETLHGKMVMLFDATRKTTARQLTSV